MASEASTAALTNRSLRTIRTELEFLTDCSVISPQQLSSLLAQLPAQTPLHVPIQSPVAIPATTPAAQPSTLSLNEKNSYQQQNLSPIPPPPAYPAAPTILAIVTALYAYSPTDAGDLALQPNDSIHVLEHMNNDWWRGRNERTGLEGIFPRSYVNVLEEKPQFASYSSPAAYGNMPLDVAQSSTRPGFDDRKPSKFEEHGKKLGKKMGNAAIFGAGATIGSNIVNGIF